MADGSNEHGEGPDDEIEMMIALGDAADLNREGIRRQLSPRKPALLLYEQGGARFRELLGLKALEDARGEVKTNLNSGVKTDDDDLDRDLAGSFTAEEFGELGGARIASILDEALKKAR